MARPKGIPNKATKAREQIISQQGVTPLAYLLEVLRDETLTRPERVDAAKAAAPYVHPRLSQVDAHHSGQIDLRAWLMKLGEPE